MVLYLKHESALKVINKSILVAGALFLICQAFSLAASLDEQLQVRPVVSVAGSFSSRYPQIRSLWLEGPPYQGRPTRAAAYLGIAADASLDHPLPAVVCVHGGGGTAFDEWVNLWNQAGYVAIAIDLEGQIPVKPQQENQRWTRNPDGGPPRIGIFRDYESPLEDQWMYHAIVLTARARNYLASLPEVDPQKIGVHGISWGSIVTENLLGRDNGFAFAILVFGCGYLDRIPNQYGDAFAVMPGNYAAIVVENWDPATRLAACDIPTFWLNWTHDKHFYLPYWNATSTLPQQPPYRRIDLDMGHGHAIGYNPAEIVAFANQVIGKGRTLPELTLDAASGDKAGYTCTWESPSPVTTVTLYQTNGTEMRTWPDMQWSKHAYTPAPMQGKRGSLHFSPAQDTSFLYVNVQNAEGLFVSSQLVELPHPTPDRN